MKIRKAEIIDLDNIMSMYQSCINGMIKNGIDQWDSTYPNSQVIVNDINNNTYYIIEQENIIGGITIDKNQDPTYLDIKWEDQENKFLSVHRLAVKENYWGQGIGKKLMLFAEKLVVINKLRSIRLDTYSGNPYAMLFYKKLGYKELGSINLKPNKNEYYCFEKIII